MAALSYTASLVRKHDPLRYICILFAPPERHEALFALHAFDVTLALIPLLVRAELAGFMRFAWWRDQVAALHTSEHVSGEPVAEALAARNFPSSILKAVMEGRAAQFPLPSLATREARRRCLEGCVTPLFHAMIYDVEGAPSEAVGALAQGWGLVQLATQCLYPGPATPPPALLAHEAHAALTAAEGLTLAERRILWPFLATARWQAARLRQGKAAGERVRLILRLIYERRSSRERRAGLEAVLDAERDAFGV